MPEATTGPLNPGPTSFFHANFALSSPIAASATPFLRGPSNCGQSAAKAGRPRRPTTARRAIRVRLFGVNTGVPATLNNKVIPAPGGTQRPGQCSGFLSLSPDARFHLVAATRQDRESRIFRERSVTEAELALIKSGIPIGAHELDVLTLRAKSDVLTPGLDISHSSPLSSLRGPPGKKAINKRRSVVSWLKVQYHDLLTWHRLAVDGGGSVTPFQKV